VLLVNELGGARELVETTRSASWPWLMVAFGLACLSVAVSAQRWRQVLSGMGYSLGFGRSLHAVLAAWPISVMTPSRAGDFVRALLVRDRVPLSASTGSVLAEKLIDVHALLVVGLVAAGANRLWRELAILAVLLVAEWLAVIMLLRGRRYLLRLGVFARRQAAIDRLYESFDRLAARPRSLFVISSSSLGIRLLTVGVIVALLRAVGVEQPFFALVAPWMLATLAGLLPFTLAGMGTRDATFVLLVQLATDRAIPEPKLVFATMGYSLLALWSFALLGLPLFAASSVKRRVSAAVTPEQR
jgi:uncharacterized protein (TIRG00374 family)